MQRRVLIFSLAYYPFVGGDGVAIKEITDRLSVEDMSFDMVTLRFDSTLPRVETIGNVRVHRIGWGYHRPTNKLMSSLRYRFLKLWFQFAAAWYGHRLHRQHRYDALWAMMAHSAGVPAVIFKKMHPKVPYILTLQEGDPPEHVEKVMRPLWLLFARSFVYADVVQAISVFLGEWARRRGFSGRLEIIPNGVATSAFSAIPDQKALEHFKETVLKKESGQVFLITTSRLVKKNAIDDVIRALMLMPEHVHFLILGIGSEEDSLRALAQSCGVEKRIHFLGHVDHADMPLYLNASDIFIRPSRSEGMGNSFIEAMAAGLPVIATQEGGIADFLFDEKRNPDKSTTGWAVDKDSPEQIAGAVRQIIENPQAVKEVTTTAQRMVREKYDWDLIAKAMKERVFEPLFRVS